MRTVIIDYGMGNLASVYQGLKAANLEAVITRDRKAILEAPAVVLPGVGAFAQGMENLEKYDLVSLLKEITAKGTPLLGICLGMQLLFEESEEYGLHQGMALLKGKIKRFPKGMKVPHMGWNALNIKQAHPLLNDIPAGSYVYFVHSYYASACLDNQAMATTNYGIEVPAIVCSKNIIGIQFHPEKSSGVGLGILKNFAEIVNMRSKLKCGVS